MKIITKSGFTCELDPKILDNMELVDALAEVQNGNSLAYPAVCLMILGKENRSKLYSHLRNQDGRVPTADVDREVTEIMNALGTPAKN